MLYPSCASTHVDSDVCACAEIATERAAVDAVAAVIETLLSVAELGRLWRLGDGHRGWLHEQLDKAARESGLPISSRPHQQRNEVDVLAERDGWGCHYCGVTLAGAPTVPRPEVEHMTPRSRGGSDALWNKVLACQPCNLAKGVTDHDDYPHTCAASEPF